MTSLPSIPKAPPAETVSLDVYQAILAASAEFGPLTKDASNSYLKSHYLSLPALLKAVREPLSDQGVVITSSFVQVGAQFVIRTMLHHCSSNTSISSDFPVLSMESPQKVGACSTYAMRYSLLHLLGIAAADDDGATVSTAPQQYVGPDPQGIERTAPQNVPQPTQPEPWL